MKWTNEPIKEKKIPSKKCSQCSHIKRKQKEKQELTEKNQFSEWKWKAKRKKKQVNTAKQDLDTTIHIVHWTSANIESHAKAILSSADYHQSFKLE